ncbi:PIN domain-containing protein [Rubellimicrobium aerolatum]|uniref:PIN domain-containing protein n=1 Tax=Rubellimicrobium aerolatum TaxID=490979 RepID=A0ABW0SGR3_9RHOB|nr:PIN domain-containing protein [Rubellimicrobium aerolatum]MBP1807453.1 hypothetical protein [Rubellimicrobium aerolatum]
MPIEDETGLRALLAQTRITAITVDTSIFDEKGLQLNSGALQALSSLKDRPFDFLMSGTIAKEVLAHLERGAKEALSAAKKAIGQALNAFETATPSRDDLLASVTGGRDTAAAARQRWQDFVDRTGCVILDDAALVDTATLFAGYFAGDPPFGSGKKKNEFPDALALHALEREAVRRDGGILVVSKDGDWRAFCERSKRLYVVREIEEALGLITNAPLGLRKAIYEWLAEGDDGSEEIRQNIADHIERTEFTANAYPSSGEVEIYIWGAELQSVEWPEEADIDIIDVQSDTEVMRVVVSLPVSLTVKVHVELNFSVWDSVDKESLGMGGREIEVEEEFATRATITLGVYHQGTADEEFAFLEGALEGRFHEIEMGEVDIFEPWDRDDHDA